MKVLYGVYRSVWILLLVETEYSAKYRLLLATGTWLSVNKWT